MADLKYTERNFRVVDWRDFEEWVKNEYGQPYELVTAINCANDSEHEYNATGKHFDMTLQNGAGDADRYTEGQDQYSAKRLQKFKHDGDFSFLSPEVFLDDAVARGNIPAGHYLIRVSW